MSVLILHAMNRTALSINFMPFCAMKSILGMGNALTDILAVLPDDTLLK